MSVGFWQVVLIVFVVLVLFGAGRLPRVMGDIGRGVRSLKEGLKDDASDDNSSKHLADKDQTKHNNSV